MMWKKPTSLVLVGAMGLAGLTGCENLPGNKKEQGAVIGGVGGAVAGGAIAKNNRLLGALIGGALGAGGGDLIGAQMNKVHDNKKDEAVAAAKKAEANPATAADVSKSDTADLNHDGFVTLDEVVAMKNAGLGDQEMIRRIQRTNQYFELTDSQVSYLRNHGVDQKVITAMQNMTPPGSAGTASGGEVIGR